jgi:hypothetical protein
VADHAGEHLEVGVRAGALVLVGLALGAVARDLGVAHEPPVVVAQGGQEHRGPEPRAVLAHAPALGLGVAAALGLAQEPLGLAGGDVLGV